MRNNLRWLLGLAVFLTVGSCWNSTAAAQAPAKGAANTKPLPPAGIDVSPDDRAELERGLAALQSQIKQLAALPDERVKALLPDVQIYERAVATALQTGEFFAAADIAKAKELLQTGRIRADALLKGDAPWAKATGLVVRGYVSVIDGSVQPYGLVIPASCQPDSAHKFRMDVWLHGRSETLSEVNFIDERSKKLGEFTPQDTIVLHPYGRYCNAYKFAGEMDVLEAMAAVKRQYRIEEDQIAIRGFSMGGAGCWHLAVHYADRWAAAAPGAGFAETEEYLKMTDDEVAALPEWQRKLFLWYDCPPWAGNLYICPTIAYNGEDDPQKQAADVMEKALSDEGITLRRIIGPHTAHKYEPEAKRTLDEAISSIVEVGRARYPGELHFTTYTLRYSRMSWVQIEGLAEHWAEANVDAATAPGDDNWVVSAETKNVTDLAFAFPSGCAPFDVAKPMQVAIDGQELDAARMLSDRSWECKLHKDDQGQWQIGPRELAKNQLRKRPGLQGPIDDAFMDSFLIVRPTGKSPHEAINRWTQAELDRAVRQWRLHFRGEPRVKDDTAVMDEDIASANLILWGDAASNAVIKRINDKLPIHWEGEQVLGDGDKYAAADHVPVLIYPNPLNPQRYVVLNSGFTFREADYGTNARQVPRLPDWAIIDIRTPPDAAQPGKIEAAGFFGEQWELNPNGAKPAKDKTAMIDRR